jgi:HD superfamily phosphohydrolase
MAKNVHEIRDPIHVFIRLSSDERRVLDSRPFQRLRHIHQLAMTYLIYPGATHRRFEHSLGVMELAGRLSKLASEVSFEGLAEAVTQAAKARRQKLAGAKAQLRKAEQRGDRTSMERWRSEVAYLEA